MGFLQAAGGERDGEGELVDGAIGDLAVAEPGENQGANIEYGCGRPELARSGLEAGVGHGWRLRIVVLGLVRFIPYRCPATEW